MIDPSERHGEHLRYKWNEYGGFTGNVDLCYSLCNSYKCTVKVLWYITWYNGRLQYQYEIISCWLNICLLLCCNFKEMFFIHLISRTDFWSIIKTKDWINNSHRTIHELKFTLLYRCNTNYIELLNENSKLEIIKLCSFKCHKSLIDTWYQAH